MFKETVETQVIQKVSKVFIMKSLADKEGLIILNPTCLSLNNLKFVDNITKNWLSGRSVPKDLLFRTDFVAYYNPGQTKKILILRNRWTGETGVFDYV